MTRTQWRSRTVTDTLGTAGAIILDDECSAYDYLKSWVMDYYPVEEDEADRLAEYLTASALTSEASEYAMGMFGLTAEFDSEWSAERSAEAIYERLAQEGEPVTMSRTAVSLGAVSLALGDDRGESGDEALAGAWWRCTDGGFGRVWDKADIEEAAEYLRAAAGKN